MFKSILLLVAIVAPTDTWPAFLGQGSTPVDPASIPLEWGPEKNIAWKSDIPGKGQSSPIIWNDKVFVTSIEGSMKETCYVVALSLKDGNQLWQYSMESVVPVRATYTQSRSAPTPVADEKHVYAFFETGGVVCLKHDGEVVWQRALTDDYGEFESTIGLASSPVVVDNKLILLIDHEGPSYLLALDTQTGETVWKTERTSRSSYSSPSIVPVGGEPQIVCSSSGSIDGYSPKTGEQLWTYEQNIGGNRTGAALPIADGTFAIGASPGMHNEREEQAKNTNFIMRVEKVDGNYVAKVLWGTQEVMPAFNSPLVYNGHAYWINRSGVVYCFDATTGEAKYTKRTNGVCWASPVGLGERVYVFGKDGVTTVLATGPEHKVLAENMLWDPAVEGTDVRASRRGSGSGHGSDSGHGSTQENGATEAPADAEKTERRGGRPQRTEGNESPQLTESEELEAARFADPVQYGIAMVNGSLVIRTGAKVYCIRHTDTK
ncbi:MAG: PQQ-binding-like beta-propeller repeat protein [Planctomycetes bacterium]|nr:PQQ-binding-like beta-propeller repeat protein [Planctomycetota bacterium]